VPRSNRVPVLSIPVGYVYCRPNLSLMYLWLDDQEYWVSGHRQLLVSCINLENILQPSKGPFLTFGDVPIRIIALHSSIPHGCNVSGVCKLNRGWEFLPNGRCASFLAFGHNVALIYFASIGS